MIDELLDNIIIDYEKKFKEKIFQDSPKYSDFFMKKYNITNELKKQNMQYWGRELGMLWQKLVVEIFKTLKPNEFKPAIKYGNDEPYDLQYKKYAIDTKYRCGSGDSGTLKKFKQYGRFIKEMGMTPIVLLFRTDNLNAAITAFKTGGWLVKEGDEAFDFILNETGYNLREYLENK